MFPSVYDLALTYYVSGGFPWSHRMARTIRLTGLDRSSHPSKQIPALPPLHDPAHYERISDMIRLSYPAKCIAAAEKKKKKGGRLAEDDQRPRGTKQKKEENEQKKRKSNRKRKGEKANPVMHLLGPPLGTTTPKARSAAVWRTSPEQRAGQGQ